MINFIDFCKLVRKHQVSVYPDGLENVGFNFWYDNSTGIEMVRIGAAFFDSSCECLLSSNFMSTLVSFDKAWDIYTKSLKQC